MLSGNLIRPVTRTPTILTRFQSIAYACSITGCYADSWAVVGSYLETIYMLLGLKKLQVGALIDGQKFDNCDFV